MPSIRYFFRLVGAFFSRFKALIAIGIGLGVIFFFVLNIILPIFGGWQVKRIGISGRYLTSTLPNNILEMVGDGLTKLDQNGQVVPNLAESWNTPDKGKTWIFKLKKGLVWQDGKPLISKNVIYQFSDAEVAYPDNETITFTLQNPYSAFPSVVSRPAFRSGLLGTGQWKVKNLNLVGDYVDQITLENNKKERIIYKFYPTEERVKLAFELGQLDEVLDIIDPKPISDWKNVKVTKDINKNEHVAVFFNMADKYLGDKNLRQALSYATNKNNLGGERAISPISENSWAYNPQVKQYSYDPIKAKSIIQAMSAEAKTNLNIVLTTSPLLLPQAELIQKDWEAVGIKTTLQVASNVPTNFQALLAIFDIPDDPDQYSIWHSTQIQTNITHYSNPRIDKLLEDGRTALNIEDRKQIYLDFQRFLVEDSPAIFLYYPEAFTIDR
ncbi:MAG TPA: ABC transporter substrate-binding protein [Patescibacteria group bacterium]|nr:ABC transporter substrate-binding protein [Patescibacteria group bacterium]